MQLTLEQAAQVAYSVCREQLQRRVEHPETWAELSDQARAWYCEEVRWRLLHRHATSAEAHAAWCERRRAEGWQLGLKDDGEKTISCHLVPFEELPVAMQRYDMLLATVVRALADATAVALEPAPARLQLAAARDRVADFVDAGIREKHGT